MPLYILLIYTTMTGTLDHLLKNLITPDPPRPRIYSAQVLSNSAMLKLLGYQCPHVVKLVGILATKKVALDASDTGVGKTYIAAAVCSELNRRPIIVCPKTLIFNWQCVLEFFGVKAYDIVNYETLRNGKTYTNGRYCTRRKATYINKLIPDPANPNQYYEWNLPADAIVIFDEAHRCKDPSTDNGKLLVSTKALIKAGIPVMLLSATICERLTDMKIPFYLTGLTSSTRAFSPFVKSLASKYPKYRVRRRDYKTRELYNIARDTAQTMIVYEEAKGHTSRIRIKDLGSQFPSNQWCAQQFVADDPDKVSEAYAQIAVLMKQLRDNPGQNQLAQIQKLKQEIEMRKVPIFIEQAGLHLEEGKSVIIFVNYLDSLKVIADQLAIRCRIHGSQTIGERQRVIDLFQSNTERIIICQIRAGGTGIGLHDLDGAYPRVTLLNYPDTASDLLQALGRAPRSGAKSPVLQRIIFVANVDYERNIMRNINRKLANISAINDGDLEGYKYAVKRITRTTPTK